MKNIAIVGVGNIGLRHFQAACAAPSVERIFLLERDEKRLAQVLANKCGENKTVIPIDSIDALMKIESIDCLISAVTTDIQTSLLRSYIESSASFILLEKPVAQSEAELAALIELGDDRKKIFVNCARNLGAGVQKIRSEIAGSRIHMEVFGNNWGLGCNLVHFIELFRFLTQPKAIQAKSAEIKNSPLPNKRGSQYEEFLGTASFMNDHGDTLQVTCGLTDDSVSGIAIMIKEKVEDKAWFLIQEKPRLLTNLRDMKSEPLGDLFVSESTSRILASFAKDRGSSAGVPTLREAGVSHSAYFSALTQALGRSVFQIT